MKKISLAVVLLTVPMLAQAWPWSQDMANQVSNKPQETVNSGNLGMTPFPARSVPVPGTMVNTNADSADKLKNPVPATEESVAKGEELFAIYCVPCHGKHGKGDGNVGQKFILQPTDLSSDQTKGRTDGFIWGHITFGGPLMPVYGNDMNPTERWHVVNYVRNVIQKAKASEPVAGK